MTMSRANTSSNTDNQQVIAIDGPAAAGKSTVAKLVADRLGALLFDTGALYRAVALQSLRLGIDARDVEGLCDVAAHASIEIRPPSAADSRLYDVVLNGEDVTWKLRDPKIGAIVSQVAEHHDVRAALLPLQRRIAASGPVVMVGRDIGTVVVPNATVKVYLNATPEERARRRFKEISARGGQESFPQVIQETRSRDEIDTSRRSAPLRVACDAIRIETDDLTVEEVVDQIESIAREKVASDGIPPWPR